jgi:tetratricopeptide (TPR) repeat protein
MNDRAGAWVSMNRSSEIQKRLFDKNPDDLAQRGNLLRTIRLMGVLAQDDGDLTRADGLSLEAWTLGQPIIAAGPGNPAFKSMASTAWDMANNRGGNGGNWNFADPVAALGWLDRMHELAMKLQASDRKAAARLLNREAVTRAGVMQQLDRLDEADASYKEALQFSHEAGNSLVESQAQFVIRYLYADYLLSIHRVRDAAATAPPVPPPLKPKEDNRAERSQRADVLAQHARIDLESGRVTTGTHEMQESLSTFEELYRSDPKDPTSMGELAYSAFALADEQALAPATRQRLYKRTIELVLPFERAHPELLSATMLIAKANLALARIETQPAPRRAYAEAAAAGFQKILAAHPAQPEAALLLTPARTLSTAVKPL